MTSPSFISVLEQQVDAAPEKVAISFEQRTLSYRELDEFSNRLARHLVSRGVGQDAVVAICGERSPELMIAVLGVLKAGAGYLPLDANYPADRLAFMLEDSRARLLIRLRGVTLDLPGSLPEQLELCAEDPLLTQGDASRMPLRHAPDGLAYAIYTSGSTGKPKGVAMVHRALDNLIEWQIANLEARANVPTLQFAPLSFDVHFQEIFSTWCSGGRLVLLREQVRLEMLELLSLLERERVERLFLPFIALQSLADIAVTHRRIPSALREVITAGEQLQITRAVVDFFTMLPNTLLFNHYGPSETHVVTCLRLQGPPTSWPQLPSIGYALPNVLLVVKDEAGQTVDAGAEGELLIGGVALARGYLYRDELTAQRFVERAGARFYRTGDLVKELPNGELQFLGRLDGQVKVRGYRIELGEVEVALSAHASVKEAAVAVHESGPGDKRLIAYLVLEDGGELGPLRSFVQGRLPEYMIPSSFVLLAALPRTPSGKVDKRALPAPTRARPRLPVEYAAPRNETERVLSQIWGELLALDGVGVHDVFFDLGGNSLLALRAVAEVQRRLAKALPIVRFFDHPTIAEQASYIADPAAFAPGGFRRVARGRCGERAAVAVIGMAARFPGANSLAQLWSNLRAGVDSVTDFSPEQLELVPALESSDPLYVAARGTVTDAERFDAGFFGVSPNEAAVLDPQQRLLLELSWSALEHAGYAPSATESVVGVYAGVHNNSYYARVVAQRPDAVQRIGEFATMLATEKDYVATRIANRLDLTGPALSIHTACSTSLVAIATAVQNLRAGLCDMAIAGGAALTVPQRSGHVYQEGGMLSRDGRTRSFDADASGTVFSDGAGMVVLKPLDRAIADGDTLYAVIRGVGLNNDGGRKASFSAPSAQGQAAVIAIAQDDAGVRARDIEYVEAHGTATPLGDPIEVEGLTQAFRRDTDALGFCALGSIKSNFGHLTAAAGVAGLIKVALSLSKEELVPTVHFRSPNPKIAFDTTPFFVLKEARSWRRGESPRRAGVSSFGVGGTNAHIVLEEAPVPAASGPSITPQLLVLSARTPAALDRMTEALGDQLAHDPSLNLADVAFTLARGRVPFAERRALVAGSLAEAARKLKKPADLVRARAQARAPGVVFLFPGQGAQYVDMGRNLYDNEALFRATVDECAEFLKPLLGLDLRSVLYPNAAQQDSVRATLKRTEITQAALFTIEYALARSLMAWGVVPSALSGHSVGEFVAACIAGVFDLSAALTLVAARGRLMQRMPVGSMLSVRASAAQVSDKLPPELDLAAENAPGLCVVSGPSAAVERFAEELTAQGIPAKLLETSHAFHSRSMDAAVVSFAEDLRRVSLARPKLPIVSTATGNWLSDAEATDPQYWATHLRRTVRFASALATLREDPSQILLEVGPRRTLTTLAMQRAPGDTRPPATAIACFADRADDDAEWSALLLALGRLWVAGVGVDFRNFFRGEKRRRVALPGYSFERDRHWLDPKPAAQAAVAPAAVLPKPITAAATSPSPIVAASVQPPAERKVMNSTSSSAPVPRSQRLVTQLKQLFEETGGMDFREANPSAQFLELGIDSLLITQLALRVKQTFRVPVSFRHLMEDASTFSALAEYLDREMPAEAAPPPAREAPVAVLAAPEPTAPTPAASVAWPAPQAEHPQATLVLSSDASAALMQQLLQLQLSQLSLFQQQLAMITPRPAAPPPPPPPVASPALPAPVASVQPVAVPIHAAPPPASAAVEADGSQKQIKYDVQKAFGAIARIHKQSDALTPRQQARVDQLTERYCAKTKSSKAHTQEHRHHHADPRVVTGFKPRIKELIYPIVTQRANGCRVWDLDGNEYIDALNGFGSNFFGYSAKFIADALHERIDLGFDIGPQTPLAGDSAAIVCELTGLDRAAFCNTGSEAVMGALRIARTVTGRNLVVAFSGSYHGIFDEVIVRDTKNMRSVPAAPGIVSEAVHNILVLEYGTDQTLAIIKERADEIAAVLVEPIQSRRPDFQPRAFLHQLRDVTSAAGSALIFDEVITGFRLHPGGAQAHYGIKADIATYGKIVGGGLPIGVIAGRTEWMDALDGGFWQFGDASVPTVGVTYFAGTFVRHPLTMTAVYAALKFMKDEGPALQDRLNAATKGMVDELNEFFKSVAAPLEIRSFSSLWKTFFVEPQPYGELLFCYLRDLGVHIWDGFPCFLTLAHGDAEIRFIIDAFKAAVREMQAGDFLPGSAPAAKDGFDSNRPPVPGARLGRDSEGNPAWFVANPSLPGKYLQLS